MNHLGYLKVSTDLYHQQGARVQASSLLSTLSLYPLLSMQHTSVSAQAVKGSHKGVNNPIKPIEYIYFFDRAIKPIEYSLNQYIDTNYTMPKPLNIRCFKS